MRFISTRDSEREFDLRDAVSQGLAPDGGLFLPHLIPEDFVQYASGDSFPAFAESLLSPFLSSSFSQAEIGQLCLDTFTFDVPLIDLKGGSWSGISILELFHGPTHSFKDFGARFLGQLLKRFIAEDFTGDTKTVVLVATSGDTGSAVAEGLSGIPGVEVVILYPENQVSAFQERQLTLVRKGVTACRVSGNFDDCQKLVKASFSEPALRDVRFTSANSINIGRLLPQMTYYAWAASLKSEAHRFCVPSGNLGNLTAGLLAWKGGLQSSGFIAGHNANRYFPDYLESGISRTRASIRTLSTAMDVGAPSNFERINSLFTREELRKLVSGYSITDDETRATIKCVFEATGYVADPHTAVGLRSASLFRKDHADPDLPIIVLSTAHPAKFDAGIDGPVTIDLLTDAKTSSRSIKNSLSDLSEIILERSSTS